MKRRNTERSKLKETEPSGTSETCGRGRDLLKPSSSDSLCIAIGWKGKASLQCPSCREWLAGEPVKWFLNVIMFCF